jgi:hypothetical protein
VTAALWTIDEAPGYGQVYLLGARRATPGTTGGGRSA